MLTLFWLTSCLFCIEQIPPLVWLLSTCLLVCTVNGRPRIGSFPYSAFSGKQDDPALFTSRQDRLFGEFPSLIGSSGQGYQRMFSFAHEVREWHGFLTEQSIIVITVGWSYLTHFSKVDLLNVLKTCAVYMSCALLYPTILPPTVDQLRL